MTNSYIENNQYIKSNSTDPKTRITVESGYKRRSVLDTSLYKKYEGLRIEKWRILLR